MADFNPDFSTPSKFDPQKAYNQVKFGSDAPALEIELNEAQQIQNDLRQAIVSTLYPNGGLMDGYDVSFSGGTLSITNSTAILNGEILPLSSLSLALSDGQTAYLALWYAEVTPNSEIKTQGNQQASDLTNDMVDSRVGEMTSHRVQIQFNLTTTNGISGHYYLTIGNLSGSTFTTTAPTLYKPGTPPANASTTQAGIVELYDGVESTETTKAATPNSVKEAYDLANAAIPSSQKGANNGVASLDSNGNVPSSQLENVPPSNLLTMPSAWIG